MGGGGAGFTLNQLNPWVPTSMSFLEVGEAVRDSVKFEHKFAVCSLACSKLVGASQIDSNLHATYVETNKLVKDKRTSVKMFTDIYCTNTYLGNYDIIR